LTQAAAKSAPRADPADAGAPTPVFAQAPDEELLFSMTADGKRKFIRPVTKRGRYWKIRRTMAVGLLMVFFGLPFIPVGGQPAVLLDILARRFHILGATFHPTDNLLLMAFGAGLIVTVFFVGSLFGRLWCGYACPQTIYLEFLFRPIEVWLEGGAVKQRKLNATPWSLNKLVKKGSKWALWSLLALAMSLTFVAYFVGWPTLGPGLLFDPLAHKGALVVTLAVAAAIVFDFGYFRDQMCTLACPYGRLQNVLADKDTLIVAYDDKRGEPRGRPKRGQDAGDFGDCLNCHSCVSACPTGTDIRRGLQLECLGVAQCIDACNAVMARNGREPGLIRYTSQREQEGGERRRFTGRAAAYLVIVTIAWGALVALVATRGDAQIEVIRGGREAFRALPDGRIANQQRLRVTNQRHELQRFTMEIVAPAEAELLVSVSPVVVEPSAVKTVNVVTTVPRALFERGKLTARYRVRSDTGFEREQEFVLLGPYQ
jgi:cytochrome c oxidase accessory protein FixG